MKILSNKKVLLLRFSSLGDVVLANFTAMKIKERHPDWQLTWLVDSMYTDIVRSQPWVDDFIEWDREKDGNKGFIRVLKEVRKRKFDMLVDLHNSDRSCLFSLFSGVPQRYADRKRFPLVHTNVGFKIFVGDMLLFQCPKYLESSTIVSPKIQSFIDNVKHPLLVLSIGASKNNKRWSDEKWAEFCRSAISKGFFCILVGAGVDEIVSAKSIINGLEEGVKNFVGQLSLEELIQVIDAVDLTISGDTGVLHVARALGKPVIGLFGPNLLDKNYMSSLSMNFYTKCSNINCKNWNCNIKCLDTISANEVLSGVETILKRLKK